MELREEDEHDLGSLNLSPYQPLTDAPKSISRASSLGVALQDHKHGTQTDKDRKLNFPRVKAALEALKLKERKAQELTLPLGRFGDEGEVKNNSGVVPEREFTQDDDGQPTKPVDSKTDERLRDESSEVSSPPSNPPSRQRTSRLGDAPLAKDDPFEKVSFTPRLTMPRDKKEEENFLAEAKRSIDADNEEELHKLIDKNPFKTDANVKSLLEYAVEQSKDKTMDCLLSHIARSSMDAATFEKLLKRSIDKDSVATLNSLRSGATKDTNQHLKGCLMYAVEHSKDKTVGYLLSHIPSLEISELDELLATSVTACVKNGKLSLGERRPGPAAKVMGALLMALKAKNQSFYFDELIATFVEADESRVIDKDKMVIPLFRIKSGIPLSVTGDDPPLLSVMKVFADSGNTTAMGKNLKTIQLLAKKEAVEIGKFSDGVVDLALDETDRVTYAEAIKKKKKDINTAIDLAIALDNSKSRNKCPAFTAIVEGLSSVSSNRQVDSEAIAKLLLGEFAEEFPNDRYGPIKELIRRQLTAELKGYYHGDKEQEKRIINIKIFLEMTRALRNEDFEMARMLARQLPDAEDRKKWTKRVVQASMFPLATAIVVVLVSPADLIGMDSATLYAVIWTALHFLIKAHLYWVENDSYASLYFTSSLNRERTIRGEINTLRPSRGLVKSLFFPSVKKEGEGAISARSIARLARDIHKHPLFQLEATFKLNGATTREGDLHTFIEAVKESRENAGTLLADLLRKGESLGVNSGGGYSNTDVLVEVFSITVAGGDLTTFKTLLNALQNEERYGKFTFDLFSMILNYPGVDQAKKTPFMLALLRHKSGNTRADLEDDTPNLESSLHCITPTSYYHLRMLAMMSKQTMRCFMPNALGQVDRWRWPDVSRALMETAELKTGPLNPHGYVDSFSAVMYGLLSELPKAHPQNQKLSEGQLNLLVEIMTADLSEKVKEEKDQTRKTVLEDNLTYISRRLRLRLAALNDAEVVATSPEEKEQESLLKQHKWMHADYRDVKNLMHYMGVLCKGHSPLPPREIWMASSEPQIKHPRLRKFLGTVPVLFTVGSIGVNVVNNGLQELEMPHLSADYTKNIVLALVFAAAIVGGLLEYLDKQGSFLPGEVKNTDKLGIKVTRENIEEGGGARTLTKAMSTR